MVRIVSLKRIGIVVVVLGLAAINASTAAATEPWWQVSISSRPQHLWAAKAEIQTITTAPVVAELKLQGTTIGCLGERENCEAFGVAGPYVETAADLQSVLEGSYGGSVEVEGGPVAGAPFVVKTPGRFEPAAEVDVVAGSASASLEGGSGRLAVIVADVGDAPAEGAGEEPITITDELPAGMVAMQAEAVAGALGKSGRAACSLPSAHKIICTFGGHLPVYEAIEMEVDAALTSPSPTPETQQGKVTVSGGGARAVEAAQKLEVSRTPVQFGIESLGVKAEAEGGEEPVTQAGAHPFQLTTTLQFDQGAMGSFGAFSHRTARAEQPALPRNVRLKLPAGLVGNPTSVKQCSEAAFIEEFDLHNLCPADSAIGVATATVIEHNNWGLTTVAVPVFNLVPRAGEPARFGFTVGGVPVVLDTEVRSGEGYGIVVNVRNLSTAAQLLSSTVTLWGDPGSPAHDNARGTNCVYFAPEGACSRPEELEEAPFLRMPTSCGSPLSFSTELEPWNTPLGGDIVDASSTSTYDTDGCSAVPFTPQIEAAPGTDRADTPTPLTVNLKIPQKASEVPQGVSEADVKNTSVTLPAGLQINPAAAAGLEGCTENDIGYLGRNPETGELRFSEESEAERSGEKASSTFCPEHSELGIVHIKTPLLKEELTGAVYQASQDANPFGSLLTIYVIAEAPKAGVRLRLAGEVKVQPNGQLVSTFPLTPQQPFERFTLEFFGGGKAPLATSGCGTYTTTSSIEPWSSSASEPFSASPSSFFDVTSGPGGSSCSSVGGFAPSFAVGTTDNAGGAYSPLTLTLNRKDGEQTLSTVSMTMPPGLAGMISAVQPCPEAQANAGDCPAASKIGHLRVSAGVGGEPIMLPEAGKPEDPVYLTGPYKGAPFGLSIVAPAEAGPFNLGTVIVRGKIDVDPHTAQVSIESEPAPTRLQGIPLDIRSVEVVVDKTGFMYNPTNCSAMSIKGSIGSSEGASEAVSSRFEAADCASLPFKPKFEVTTKAKHTRRYGAYLHVKVSSGAGQAHLKSVYVELPKLLPSRQETLKLACAEATFAANPASCPADSHVGTAVVHTPVLPVPLTGAAMLVSHGGAGFPDLDLVLQGDNVTIEQTGTVNIEKGITSTDFGSVPDAPIDSIELTLPEGAHSILAATGNLCSETVVKKVETKAHGRTVRRKRSVIEKRDLSMPTVITAQNGAVIKEATTISVTGCPKLKKKSRSKAAA